MKIYEIGTGYTPIPAQMGAATEIVVEELTRSFLKIGENAEIIDISADERAQTDLPVTEVKVPKCFTKKDVSLGIMHKLKRVVYSIALAKKLKKILKNTDEKVIIHFHNQYNMYFFLKLVSKKLREKAFIAYTNHSYIWHGKWEEIKDTINKRYFQEVLCLKEADRVFVLNGQTMTNITENLGVSPKKITLIDNGVNTDVYSVLNKTEIKKKFNLEGKTVFTQVGSVCDRKNQLTSVKLLLPLMKENKDIVFCYAGGIISEEYQQEIKDFARDNAVSEQVLYFGELAPGKELNEFYNLSEAMIFPSKAEGFSLVIIEAMSAGVPVCIDKNLQFKLSDECIKFADEKEFIELISKLILSEERNELSNKVRTAVLKGYSWDKVAEDYLQAINEENV